MSDVKTDISSDRGANSGATENFDLGGFFPYQVRVYYRAISEAVSNIYSDKFGLTVSEWRTMAVLGPFDAFSASEIVARSSMDKVNVSRAIKGLQARGFLKRDIDEDDRRRVVLRLTKKGRDVFEVLVPLVKQVEKDCLNDLSNEEQAQLKSLMQRVRSNAENLMSGNDNKMENQRDE